MSDYGHRPAADLAATVRLREMADAASKSTFFMDDDPDLAAEAEDDAVFLRSVADALDALVARCEQLARERDALQQEKTLTRPGHARWSMVGADVIARAEAAERRVAELEAALPEDTPELRHWLGSQDVIGSKTTVQIARFVHSGLAARAALEGGNQ